jgi:hypothetical protein
MFAINPQHHAPFHFPTAALDGKLQNVIHHLAQETQASPDLIASSVLGVMALACQDLFDISPKQNLRIPVSLYQIILAESGERKTTVDKILMTPIRDLERKLESVYLAEKKEHERAVNIWSVEHRALEKAFERSVTKDEDKNKKLCAEKLQACWERKPVAPIRKRLLINDATRAAVKLALGTGWPSIGLISDEAGSILNGELLRDTPLLNSLWSGQSIEVDRATGDSFRIADARLGCMLMIQPKLFEDFVKRQGHQARASGFFARTLLCQPRSTIGQRFNRDNALSHSFSIPPHSDPSSLEWFHSRASQLLEQGFERREHSRARICLTLSPEARFRWNEEYNRIESNISLFGPLKNFKDYASKQLEHVSRIAGVLEGFVTGGSSVSAETMFAAIQIASWYLDSFIHLMSDNTLPEEIQDANILYSWLERNHMRWINGVLPKNNILKFGPNPIRNKERLNRALGVLSFNGKIVLFKHGRTSCVKYLSCFNMNSSI